MARQLTILIVEDDPDTRNLISRIVHMADPSSRILTADNGETGLSMALQDPPDLIITDLGIPSLDGHDLVQSLQREMADRRAPIIGTTAHDLADPKTRAFYQLCDAFVFKPLDVEDLRKKVGLLVGCQSQVQPACA